VVATPDLFAESAAWWSDVCAGVDTVIHAAWYAEPGKYLTSERNLDCLAGTVRLAQGAARSGVRRFVGIGTCFEYDLTGGTLSVETPLRPLTPYAAAKAAAFLTLSQWLPLQQVGFCWCRLFYLFGEGEDSRRLVPYLRAKLAGGIDFAVPADIGDEYTLAETDQRHRLVFNGIWQPGFGFQVSGVYFYGSGERDQIEAGDINRDVGEWAVYRYRENGTIIPRNSFVGDPIHRVDLRLQERIPNYLQEPPAKQLIADAQGRPAVRLDQFLDELVVT